jgi:TrmH RNA methyltransferase
VYGLNAVLGLFAQRPQAIRAISHTEDVRLPLAPLLRAAAQRRLPYREVSPDELTRIAGSEHHEGVAVLADARPLATLEELATALLARSGVVVALDEVENPHNLGAILRSSAYFGAVGVLFASGDTTPRVPPSAVRVAQGAAELLVLAGTAALARPLAELGRRGVHIVGADTRAPRALHQVEWPRPLVVVLGNERSGLLPETRRACQELVSIPGTGQVESLNVSVAAGVVLAQATCGTRAPSPPSRRRP